jgi:TonB family protein
MYGPSNSTNAFRVLVVRLLAAACVALAGCASPAFVKEKIESSTPLAEAKDGRIHAAIETVILRNGPGTTSIRGVTWDEYLIRIRALSDEPVEIREVAIFDALDHRIESRSDPRGLVQGTLEIERRYRESGKLVTTPWVVSDCAIGAPHLVLLPAALVVGVACITYRDAQISSEILRRRTTLPVDLPSGAEASVDLFFPVTPHSGRAQVVYTDGHGEHRLDIDTRQALVELGPPMLVSRIDAEFPDEARARGINRGYVKAQLTLDRHGRVQAVEVIESKPRRFFEEEARRTFRGWTYTESRDDGRTVVAILQFKR